MSRTIADKINKKIKLGRDRRENICRTRSKLKKTEMVKLVLGESLRKRQKRYRETNNPARNRNMVRGWGGKNKKRTTINKQDKTNKSLEENIFNLLIWADFLQLWPLEKFYRPLLVVGGYEWC